MHYEIKHCKVHHFADNTNFLNFGYSIKTMSKKDTYDSKIFNSLLNASKLCLNISETEVVPFRSLTIQIYSGLHFKLNRKCLYPTNSVRYLGIIIDKNPARNHHINNISAKINKVNVILPKLKHFDSHFLI